MSRCLPHVSHLTILFYAAPPLFPIVSSMLPFLTPICAWKLINEIEAKI